VGSGEESDVPTAVTHWVYVTSDDWKVLFSMNGNRGHRSAGVAFIVSEWSLIPVLPFRRNWSI